MKSSSKSLSLTKGKREAAAIFLGAVGDQLPLFFHERGCIVEIRDIWCSNSRSTWLWKKGRLQGRPHNRRLDM